MTTEMADMPAETTDREAPTLPGGIEVRSTADLWPDVDLQIRMVPDGDGMTFEGYAAVFNRDSNPIPAPMGSFIETVRPGAFKRTLGQNRDIRMFWNHNPDILLGSTPAKTLGLREDEVGLKTIARLPDTTAGRDASVLIKRGDVNTMSFAFAVAGKNGERWSEDYGRRDLLELSLYEVSPISGWAAYPDTQAMVRHLAQEAQQDEGPLAEAFRVLHDAEGRLTEQQRDLLIAAVSAHTESAVAPTLAHWREIGKLIFAD